MHILVTGAAGFIGFHLAQRLLARGDQVTGVDNLNDYYSVQLKRDRLAQLREHPAFEFHEVDLAQAKPVMDVFSQNNFARVAHMAAQAGVRYSVTNPHTYIQSNVTGFLNVLEGCRQLGTQHLVYASSSSVYGANTRTPFSVHDAVDHPVSLYAATKKANELMAHSYAHLYGLPVTGLRFFTVYGPWGRPDMAYFKFTKALMENRPIDVYGDGRATRDFTYIDDVLEGLLRALDNAPVEYPAWNSDQPDPSRSRAPYRLYNIGNNRPNKLMHLVTILEHLTGRVAERRHLPTQPGDVLDTCADVSDTQEDLGFMPSTPLESGLERFVAWYRTYYKI